MKDMGRVHGNGTQARDIVVGVDTVYVHTDIVKLDRDNEGKPADDLYEYNEVQYTKDEFLAALSNGQVHLDGRATDLEEAILEMSMIIYQ